MTLVSEIPHPSLAVANRHNVLRIVTHTFRIGDETIHGDFYINKDHLIVSPNCRVELVEPEAHSQNIIIPRSSILHSNAGPSKTGWMNLIKYWRRKDITGEAHFQVPLNDKIVQAMPLNRKADCNYKANGFWLDGKYYGAISFETGDNGHPTLDKTPWTPTQLAHIIGVNVCLAVVYGIWCTTPAYWTDTGIGHHSQFKEWSSYVGKTCPGAARIRQMDFVRSQVAERLALYGQHTGWQCGGTYK